MSTLSQKILRVMDANQKEFLAGAARSAKYAPVLKTEKLKLAHIVMTMPAKS